MWLAMGTFTDQQVAAGQSEPGTTGAKHGRWRGGQQYRHDPVSTTLRESPSAKCVPAADCNTVNASVMLLDGSSITVFDVLPTFRSDHGKREVVFLCVAPTACEGPAGYAVSPAQERLIDDQESSPHGSQRVGCTPVACLRHYGFS